MLASRITKDINNLHRAIVIHAYMHVCMKIASSDLRNVGLLHQPGAYTCKCNTIIWEKLFDVELFAFVRVVMYKNSTLVISST